MAIKFRCPTCNELFSAQDDMAGAQMTCPMCFAEFELPRGVEPPAPRERRKPLPKKSPPRRESAPAVPEVPSKHIEKEERESQAEASLAVALPVRFRARAEGERNELDMTPMVDVTFLLLIFFMVTAAFGLQKSYDIPAPDDTRPSASAVPLEELQNDPQYVIVRVDRYDTFHVSAATWEMEREAPSKPDLLAKLRTAKASGTPAATHLLVMASEDATNGKVITALDAGTTVGMEDVKLMTMPSEE